LREQEGGAGNALLLAVVRQNPGGRGKDYYSPTKEDFEAVVQACSKEGAVSIEMPPAPPQGDSGFRPRPYGITNWAHVLTPRQKLSRWIIHEAIEDALKEAAKRIKDQELLLALAACLYAAYSDNAQYHTSLCVWLSEGVKSIFIQGMVRLIPVSERARHLFEEDGAERTAEWIHQDPNRPVQLNLFSELKKRIPKTPGRGRRRITVDLSMVEGGGLLEATTLDRVHAAMLLQAGGQTNALRALIRSEQDRGPGFLRLANALSALYPKSSEEKRLLDAMLLAAPR
jgi:hypothetical protein